MKTPTTKPKEQHISSILCKCPSCIRKIEIGYAQALKDVENIVSKIIDYTPCNTSDPVFGIVNCGELKQRIQALKNHSQEGTKPCKGKEVSNPPQQHLVNSSDSSECASDSPSGDLCQNCGHERFLHFINQRKGKCGYSENNVTHDCDCKQFKPMKLCVNCKIRDKCEGLEYIDSTQCAYFTPKEQK